MEWEYKTIRLKPPVADYAEQKVEHVLDDLTPQLNDAGRDGWELVNVLDTEALGYTNFVVAVFKRPRQ
jgi:Domain of unknown function (DUF4177)